MKAIKKIAEQIRAELDGAKSYAMDAMAYKDNDRALGDVYAKMAEAKLGNVDTLHAQATRMIKAVDGQRDVPSAMRAVWSWEHEHMIEAVAHVRQLLAMYKG